MLPTHHADSYSLKNAKEIPAGSFILIGQIPQSLNRRPLCCRTSLTPLATAATPHTRFISRYVFSSSPESIVLSLPSRQSALFISFTHIFAALPRFSVFVSLAFIFDPFSSSGHWSLWLSAELSSSNTPPSLCSPLLDLCYLFFCFDKRISRSRRFSFHLFVVFVVFVNATLTLQMIYLSLLPGYTEPLPARRHS